jgi:hypothetical protein
MRAKAGVVVAMWLVSADRSTGRRTSRGSLQQVGDTVFVTDATGAKVEGPLTGFALRLTVAGREFRPAPGLMVQRRGIRLGRPDLGRGPRAVAGLVGSSGECGVKWSTAKCTTSGCCGAPPWAS